MYSCTNLRVFEPILIVTLPVKATKFSEYSGIKKISSLTHHS